MPSPLNIRDIGGERKAALEAEARRAGMSVAQLVRTLIDAGIASSRAARDRAAWIASARAGLEDEARQLDRDGPSLARFRRF